MGVKNKSLSHQICINTEYAEYRPEPYSRGGIYARGLIEMDRFCYEMRHLSSCAARDCLASQDGDDVGWTIAKTLDDNETPVNEKTMAVLMNLVKKKFQGKLIVGGKTLSLAIKQSLTFGDSFFELGIDREVDGKYGIVKTHYLPCWEMHRIENEYGDLECYEQRRSFGDNDPIKFLPPSIVQFSNERKDGYGRSLWEQSLVMGYWDEFKKAWGNQIIAAKDMAVSPTIFTFPDFMTQMAKDNYVSDLQSQSADGVIPYFFMDNGVTVEKLINNAPNLNQLLSHLTEVRLRLIPAGFPVWYIPGLQTVGAKEISNQPALIYSRMRNDWCGLLAEGIKQICDIELILKLGYDHFREKGEYRIVFPKWIVDPQTEMVAEANREGISDYDEDVEPPKTENEKNGKAKGKLTKELLSLYY
jgi:hypothetical protein